MAREAAKAMAAAYPGMPVAVFEAVEAYRVNS